MRLLRLPSKQQQEVNSRFNDGVTNINEGDLNNIAGKKDKAFSLIDRVGRHAADLKLLWNLMCDYKDGKYKSVPWKLIAAIVFAFAYLISPVDVIPDVIPVLGLTDDISVFGLVLAGFASEIEAYKVWKESR